MKKVLCVVLTVVLMLSLVGCGSSKDIKELTQLSAVDSEADVSIVSLSSTDKENLIYSQVSDRTLLDLSALTSPSAEEVESAKTYMDSVDAQLCGTLDPTNGVIDTCFTDYLLFEFEKTPYYWQRSSMSILGVDASSRSIVLDVTYNTIDFAKSVKGISTIVRGEPSYDKKMEVRFNRYIEILNKRFSSYNSGDSWESDMAKFESVYGSVNTILEEQNDSTLTETAFKFGNQISYSGLVNNEIEKSKATMTVRYVLTPTYSMGINLGLNCTHMYITGYNLKSSEVNNEAFLSSSVEDETGIAEECRKTLSSYYSSIDDENFYGLYSLVSDFGNLDKYFSDYFSTTYHKYDNFSVTIHSIQGTRIECTAVVSRKVRARGSEMSLPIYTDTYYYVLNLDNGVLKIAEEVLLSSKIEGEPAISTEGADITGFSTSITLSSQDKLELETLVSEFSVLQLNKDTLSSDFSKTVDTSISSSQLSTLKDNMNKLEGVQKVTWITSYLQGTDSYASIRCKELVQKDDGVLYDCSVTYDFIKKGGDWYIYGYTVNSKNKLDSTNLATKNCLCIVTKEGVSLLDSKVTVSTDGTEGEQVVGVTVNYSVYTPTPKDTSLQYQAGGLDASEKTPEECVNELNVIHEIDVDMAVSLLEEDTQLQQIVVGLLNAYNAYYAGETDVEGCINAFESYSTSGVGIFENWRTSVLDDLNAIKSAEEEES